MKNSEQISEIIERRGGLFLGITRNKGYKIEQFKMSVRL